MTIKEQLKICDAATPGEWHNITAYIDGSNEETPAISLGGNGMIYDEGGHTLDDARFICLARTKYPAALRLIEAIEDAAHGSCADASLANIKRLIREFEGGE